MKKPLREQLIPKGRTIYFNEEAHKYSNELGFVYTSTTTVIGKYYEHQDFEEIAKACERIGRNPNHKDYLKYKGKTYRDILKSWDKITVESCGFGSAKHNFLETSVKTSNNYFRNANGFIDGRIYTIDDIIYKHSYGKVNLKVFEKQGVKERYPKIYTILESLVKEGFHIYAEIGVYDDTYGVSGLIDILCINHKTRKFIIVDWKTNKAPIRFDSGYYKKDVNGLLDLNNWFAQDKRFLKPLTHLADSVGNHYTLQLSTYAYLVETWGYELDALLLCHIRPIEQAFISRDDWEEVVEPLPIKYLKNDVMSMLDDFRMKNIPQQGVMQFL